MRCLEAEHMRCFTLLQFRCSPTSPSNAPRCDQVCLPGCEKSCQSWRIRVLQSFLEIPSTNAKIRKVPSLDHHSYRSRQFQQWVSLRRRHVPHGPQAQGFRLPMNPSVVANTCVLTKTKQRHEHMLTSLPDRQNAQFQSNGTKPGPGIYSKSACTQRHRNGVGDCIKKHKYNKFIGLRF